MLYLPEHLPAAATLVEEGAAIGRLQDCPACSVARILLLNLMPQKAVTELDFARTLAQEALDVALIPMKIAGQTYKNTPMSHMEAFYTDFDALRGDRFDGLIVTGAPVEQLAFEDVRYWRQLCDIMDWAATHVRSTLYVCWGAQAALYHRHGIRKHALPAKKFGIFQQSVLSDTPLFRGLTPAFPMPNSRHTEVRREDFPTAGSPLRIVAESEESGVGVAMTADGRGIYIVGHLEYEPATLEKEYLRDRAKGLPIAPPAHYYRHDDPQAGIDYSWRQAARTFYRNWVEHFVCPAGEGATR